MKKKVTKNSRKHNRSTHKQALLRMLSGLRASQHEHCALTLIAEMAIRILLKEQQVKGSTHRAWGRRFAGAALCVRWEEDVVAVELVGVSSSQGYIQSVLNFLLLFFKKKSKKEKIGQSSRYSFKIKRTNGWFPNVNGYPDLFSICFEERFQKPNSNPKAFALFVLF